MNNYNIDVYLAKCDESSQTDFKLKKYSYDLSNHKDVERINDTSKHIVLLFESVNPSESNDYVYKEFENVIDTISLQYKSICGVLPRLNLVGHCRGGLTNIQYATNHPYNVAMVYRPMISIDKKQL